jgi:3-oxoacyl-[acyl-carrier-protein] synthase II
MKRVVVTGMGVISPVGNSVAEFWSSLLAGKCGIDFITRFDASEFKVKIAAEVKDFDAAQYMEKSEARKTDLYARYAIAAAVQAMEDSGYTVNNPKRLGVYVGSGIGGMETFMTECQKLSRRGPAGYPRTSSP